MRLRKRIRKGENFDLKRVTVKDIAKASGYSVATVSKTLNGTDRVGAETIEKIKRIAAEMGYRSSFSAQALVRKPRRVAIVLFRTPAEVRSLFEAGFTQSFDLYSEFGLEADYHYFDSLTDVDWDAIEQTACAAIVTPGAGLEACSHRLEALGTRLPLVLLQSSPELPLPRLCGVTVNARVVGMMAAQFLSLTSGHVGVLTGYGSRWIHRQNLNGFLHAAGEFGLNHLSTAETYDRMDVAYDAARRMMKAHPQMDGLFVTSYVSPAVCQCAADLNRPMHIIGVDLFADSISCLRSGTLAAAIFQNQQRQAQLALEAVVNHLRGIAPENSIQVKPELVLRTNCSCYGWL